MSEKDNLECLPSTRMEAKKLGVKWYFTNIFCVRNHLDKRLVSNGSCYSCSKNKSKDFNEKNKEKLKEKYRKYNSENKEKRRLYRIDYDKRFPEKKKEREKRIRKTETYKNWRKKYTEKNKDEILQKNRDWREKNKETIRKKVREYYKKNSKMFIENAKVQKAKRRAAKANSGGSFTKKQLLSLKEKQKNKCGFCYCKLDNIWHADHIVPLISGGSNYISNIQILCPTCNLRKNSKDPIVFAQENGKLL